MSERAVLPGGGSVGRGYDRVLLPRVREAGFVEVSGVWAAGVNGQELLLLARRPPV